MMNSKDDDLLNLYGQDNSANISEENIVLEGELSNPIDGDSSSGPGGKPSYSTLDEPIKETILRDLKAVGAKFKHVILPVESNKKSLLLGKEFQLRNCWSLHRFFHFRLGLMGTINPMHIHGVLSGKHRRS